MISSRTLSRCSFIMALAAIGLCVGAGALAAVPVSVETTLDGAGPANFAVVDLGGAFTFSSSGSSDGNTITSANNGVGNVGLVQGSSTSISGGTSNTTSSGALDLGPGISAGSIATVATFAGGINTNVTSLSTGGSIATDASTAATTFSQYAADQNFSSGINSTTTVTATHSGVNVIDVYTINIGNSKTLTFSAGGYSNVQFVVNVTGAQGIQVSGNGALMVSGIADTDVVYNVRNGVALSGTSTNYGIFLDANNSISAYGAGQVDGELIGNGVQITSGARVFDDYQSPVTPEPGSLSMLVGAGAPMLGLLARKRMKSARSM